MTREQFQQFIDDVKAAHPDAESHEAVVFDPDSLMRAECAFSHGEPEADYLLKRCETMKFAGIVTAIRHQQNPGANIWTWETVLTPAPSEPASRDLCLTVLELAVDVLFPRRDNTLGQPQRG